MATLYISSVEDLARARDIEARIISGDLPEPPASKQQKRNQCDKCHTDTILRYYVERVGWVCADCKWPTPISICTTRADKVHRGRFHIAPVGLFELYDAEHPAVAPVAAQDARSVNSDEELIQGAVFRLGLQQDARHAKEAGNWVAERVVKIRAQRGPESVVSEERWHDARKAGEAKRGNVLVAPWA